MIKRIAFMTLVCLGMAMTTASQASAQEVFDELTDGHLTNILQDLGYENVEVIDKNEDTTTFRFDVDGRTYLMMNYRRVSDVRIFIYFVNDAGVTRSTLTTVNEWNRDKRWAKAYLDSEGDWTLEADFDVQPGVTEAAISQFIRLWMNTVDDFVEHIDS